MRVESPAALRALAAAVADGEDVDWVAAHRRLSGERERRLAEHLRFAGTRSGAAQAETRAASAAAPLWFRALAAWSLAHVIGGAFALILAPPDRGPIPPFLLTTNALMFSGVAVALLVARERDRRALDLAGVFLCIASACSHRPLRWLMVGEFASSSALALFRGLLPEAFLPFLFWRFVAGFPRVLRLGPTDGLVRVLIALSAVAGLLLFVANAVAYATSPARPHDHPSLGWLARAHPSGLHWVVLLTLCLAALATAVVRSRESPRSERRRFSMFVAGLVVGLGPLFATILTGFAWAPAQEFIEGRGLFVIGLVIFVPMLVLPPVTAYAVAARRVLDVRFALRGAGRLALGRTAVVGLAVVITIVAGVYLYVHRDESVAALRAAILAWGGGLAGCLGLLWLRPVLLRGLDALAYGGESTPASAIADLGARLRQTVTLLDTIEVVREHVARSTRTESGAVYGRDESSGGFSALGSDRTPLPSESALVRLLREDDAPVITDPLDGRSVFAWLPQSDREWVLRNRVSGLVGLAGPGAGLPAFMATGPKVDERPWSRDDRALLSAIATPAALALQRLGLGTAETLARTSEAAAECQACGQVHESTLGACPCGGSLSATPLPAILNGKFRLVRVLGRGGMGVVYEAFDIELGRTVALKTLPRVATHPALRLRTEARSMATFVHPHLALIFGAESWAGVPVLVVEHLAGGTLARRMKDGMDVRAVLSMGRALAGALEAVHGKGWLHRDIKPSNIGFTEDGVPKLLDFGLARLLGAESGLEPPAIDLDLPLDELTLTPSGHIVGTPLYMSPEARAGAPPEAAHDVWALSLVLWEALAGIHPWRGRPSFRACPGIADVRSLNPGVPPAIAELLSRALGARAELRFRTATDFRRSLEEAARDTEGRMR